MIHHASPPAGSLELNALMKDVFIFLTYTIMFYALSISYIILIWPYSTISTVPGWRAGAVLSLVDVSLFRSMQCSGYSPTFLYMQACTCLPMHYYNPGKPGI